jgi:hypothetical protein
MRKLKIFTKSLLQNHFIYPSHLGLNLKLYSEKPVSNHPTMACPIESITAILVSEPYQLPESAEGVILCSENFLMLLSVISEHTIPQHLRSTPQDLIPRVNLSQKHHKYKGPIHNRNSVSSSLIVWDVSRRVCTHIIITMPAITWDSTQYSHLV